MIRVLHITESIPASAGGTSAAFAGLVEALRTQPTRLDPRALTQALAPDDATHTMINARDGLWIWTGPRGRFRAGRLGQHAADTIDQLKPHVVHIHGLWCPDLVFAARHALRRSCRLVWQPHGMMVREAMARSRWKKQLFLALGLRSALARTDALVFTSDTERATSLQSQYAPNARPEVIPLPVRIEPDEGRLPALRAEGRARLNIPARTPLAVFVGRLHPVKRVHLTLGALAQARESVPEARLVLIGDGDGAYVEQMRSLARELGVLEAVTFAGWLSGDDKWRTIAAADALLLNSEFENFGFAAVEALDCHVPVIMTDNLSLAAPAAQAGAGLVCPSSAEALGHALATLLTSADRAAMGRAGRAWVARSFSHQVVGSALADLYESLARGAR
jgi:glycosyltransferase involved in cell wall biosynthesis